MSLENDAGLREIQHVAHGPVKRRGIQSGGDVHGGGSVAGKTLVSKRDFRRSAAPGLQSAPEPFSVPPRP